MTTARPLPSLARHRGLCRSCGVPVVWAVTRKGKSLPLNPASDKERGNVLLYEQDGQLLAHVFGRNQAAGARERGERLYLPHAADCGNVSTRRHRQRRTPAARQHAEERHRISQCRLCDGDGYRWHPDGKQHGVLPERCDHEPGREVP